MSAAAPAARLIRMRIEYDGTDFCGWQRQTGQPSVQAAVEDAIRAVTGETVGLTSASRTDTGVHALGQIATFRTATRIPSTQLAQALSANLPKSICVRRTEAAPDGFHPRKSARRKRYEYRFRSDFFRAPLQDRFWTHLAYKVDLALMHDAAKILLGTHDFRGFATKSDDYGADFDFSRTITHLEFLRPSWDDPFGVAGGSGGVATPGAGFGTDPGRTTDDGRDFGGAWILRIEADGFLHNMIRAIMGTLFLIGRGKEPAALLDQVLHSRERSDAGPTAPPQGLCLMQIYYPPEFGDL